MAARTKAATTHLAFPSHFPPKKKKITTTLFTLLGKDYEKQFPQPACSSAECPNTEADVSAFQQEQLPRWGLFKQLTCLLVEHLCAVDAAIAVEKKNPLGCCLCTSRAVPWRRTPARSRCPLVRWSLTTVAGCPTQSRGASRGPPSCKLHWLLARREVAALTSALKQRTRTCPPPFLSA